MSGKPPLAVSPRRLRPRRPPTSLPALRSPTVKATPKPPAPFPTRHSIAGEPLLRKNCSIFSFDLPEPTKKAKDDFTPIHDPITCTNPLFERGRFYELYSARRNERLKRKMMEISEETVALYPEVAVELSKKRSLKKAETPRKSCPGSFSVSRASSLRSSAVRSSYKDVKRASAMGISSMASVDVGKKIMTRSALRKII
ncbi:uncharacterized protein LOC110020447 [Phalaenopsis equestris]|uniref:uncharacterized protein LOC110020447 n=1 Tax=Phalaenopsis equestris TaxID=78828 RepID=UPI0009E2EFEF|nr:uncharacterized protein LOC110020447 [Phalaenopsis equestris]